ncbi:MAG: nicotinate phosphoribosyltransferase [Polyangiaceae bacterium]
MDALRTDLYQLTMAAGYFHRGMKEDVATCEMFIRRIPKARRYLVAMGRDRVLRYLEGLRFTTEEIDFLATVPALKDAMTPAFREYLARFRFTGDVWAVPEGTVVFANEPLFRVTAPIIEAQLVETYLLSVVNHATMVATKAARIVRAAGDAGVVEFGTRRTHPGEALDAARDACAAGCVGTSNVEAGMRYGLKITGTAAHMWTMAHASEEEAFKGYVEIFPNASILLIDTYDTLRGAERAAKIAREKLQGVRLDSGDLLALSKGVRKVLDENGCKSAKIVASGDLNEYKIEALRSGGAPIDLYGVGTDLVSSIDAPSMGGVYKLVEHSHNGERSPIAKFSEGKGTLPGPHQVWRFARDVGFEDVIALADEDPKALREGPAEGLLEHAFSAGKRVGPKDTIDAIRARVKAGLDRLPPEAHVLSEGPPAVVAAVSPRLAELVEEVRARFVAH